MSKTEEKKEIIPHEEAKEEFYNTVDQERILLKYLFTQVITARKYFVKIQEDVFTSPIRIWLFRTAKEIFRNTSSLFDESTIDSELDRVKKITLDLVYNKKRITKEINHTKAKAEWNIIYATELKHTPEWLIEDLERKKRAKAFMERTEAAIQKVLEGKSDDAINDLNSDLIQIKSRICKDKPIRRFSDPSWQVEVIRNKQEHPEDYAGIKLGFPQLDGGAGAYRGELMLITAHTGVGKSTLLRSMALGAAENGSNVLFIVNEEIEEQAGNKFASSYTDIMYSDLKSANKDFMNEETIKSFEEQLKEFGETHGEIFIQELPQFHSCAEIEQILIELEQQGEKIDLVILDYLDHLKPIEKAWSEVDEQSKAIAEFKNVCMNYRVSGITATQADTASVNVDNMNAYNVRGSKQKSGAANVVIAIKELLSEEERLESEDEDVTWKVSIIKNRDGKKFSFKARFRRSIGIVVEYDFERASAEERELVEAEAKKVEKKMSKKKKREKVGSKSLAEMKEEGLPKKDSEEELSKEVVSEMHDLDDISDEDMPETEEKKAFKQSKKSKLPPGIKRKGI